MKKRVARPMTMRQAALSVLKRLRSSGHEALYAGGCVRDTLMGRRPKDYDIATDAPPKRIVDLFRRTRKVGMQFGVVLVGVQKFWIEVATFRSDGDYSDGRRPDQVTFTNAREDALRRDFTINGMFYDPIQRHVIDYIGGESDLKAGVIRAIGPPDQRFAEDHLRMLRAIRFASRFDFEIEPATRSAIRADAARIARVSAERIRMEIELILQHRNRAPAFEELAATGLLPHLWPNAPELLPHLKQITALLKALPEDASIELALAALFHCLPAPLAESTCKSLCCSNRTTSAVRWLIARQDDLSNPDSVSLADLKMLMVKPPFADLLALLAAKLRATGQPLTPYCRIVGRVGQIPAEEIAPPPLITGKYLGKLGLPAGPKYKKVLDRVYYAQLNGDLLNRAAARKYASKLAAED